ncbi:hypothetical protein JMJ58_21180 (plasmid) [Haloterrigena salifodinae]|uniref:Uncharacterized protein n=1 Tax=Haloterrigena salifodinae TaxID=2675099 RepID=A0A8T8E7L5_9EURY|nr:hypothetical protein [Haloterrigena salifodinae]QRV17470.1 hypothetical protein JMJ58_21180 [Haloterrigena salifodinae]
MIDLLGRIDEDVRFVDVTHLELGALELVLDGVDLAIVLLVGDAVLDVARDRRLRIRDDLNALVGRRLVSPGTMPLILKISDEGIVPVVVSTRCGAR